MNPPRYPACPARCRRSFSSSVSGQVKPANSTRAPYTAAGMCAQTTRGHRQARKAPPTTKPMNSRWTTTTRSAAVRYHIWSPGCLSGLETELGGWLVLENCLALDQPRDAECDDRKCLKPEQPLRS